MIRWSRALTTTEYAAGLTAIAERMSDVQRRLLIEQYHAPRREVTAPQLARLAAVNGGYSIVNVLYGRLGRLFCNHSGATPDIRQQGPYRGKPRFWAVWSSGLRSADGYVWRMLPQVAEALEQLAWVGPPRFRSPDEVVEHPGPLIEGAVYQVTVNAYERNQNARRECIAAYGTTCFICGFDFAATYGAEFQGYIHVHHLRPLSECVGEYEVNPIDDLRPVCPNCHAAIHFGGNSRTIDEVKSLISR